MIEDGKIVIVNDQEFECVSVSYQETDGVRYNFAYTLRPKADVDAEREAEQKRLEEAEILENGTTAVEEPTKPEEPQEETQYVR